MDISSTFCAFFSIDRRSFRVSIAVAPCLRDRPNSRMPVERGWAGTACRSNGWSPRTRHRSCFFREQLPSRHPGRLEYQCPVPNLSADLRLAGCGLDGVFYVFSLVQILGPSLLSDILQSRYAHTAESRRRCDMS